MGVEVLLDTKVTDCDRMAVMLGTSASMRHHRLGRGRRGVAGGGMDRGRSMIVPGGSWSDRDLSHPVSPNIFVAGDLASVQDKNGKPVPGIAPAAKQMGRMSAS